MPKIVTEKKENTQRTINEKVVKGAKVSEVKYSAIVHSLEIAKGNLTNYHRARVHFQLKLCTTLGRYPSLQC